MGISVTHRATSFDDANASGYTIPSFSWGANDLILCGILSAKSSTPDIPTSLTTTGLTWVRITGVAYDLAGTQRRLDVYRAMSGSGSSGTIAVAYPATAVGIMWSIVTLAGVDTSGTNGSGAITSNVNTANGVGTSGLVTLPFAVLSASDAIVGFFAADVSVTFTAGSGFAIAGQSVSGGAPVQAIMSESQIGSDLTVDCTTNGAVGDQWGGVALEIKIGPQTVTAGQATEADAAQAPARAKRLTVIQATAADTGQAVGRTKARSTSQAVGADQAQAASAAKSSTAGQAAETDAAQVITHSKAIAAGQALETDTTNAVGRVKAVSAAAGVETDVAAVATTAKRVSAGIATEADSILTAGVLKARTAGQASETDTAQPATTSTVSAVLGHVSLIAEGLAAVGLGLDHADVGLAAERIGGSVDLVAV